MGRSDLLTNGCRQFGNYSLVVANVSAAKNVRMFCPECGAEVQQEDPYCGECGAKQEALPPSPPPIVAEVKKGHGDSGMPRARNSKDAPGAQLEPGTLLLDRYSIVKRVGGGGMGSVYQARDKRLAERSCA